MKRLLIEYLAGLREREELDAVLPEVLVAAGLRVYSRPQRGSKQYGVDVAAVGSLGDEPEAVHLLSIKAGNLTRTSWDGQAQALRPSLDEIVDVYLTSHLPPEHAGKPVRVWLCCGGRIEEPVRQAVTAFQARRETERLKFQEWDGERLAGLIESVVFSEELVPGPTRLALRKAVANLEEPEVAVWRFVEVLDALAERAEAGAIKRGMVILQMAVSLRILDAACREAGNLEAAYLAAERVILLGWEAAKPALPGASAPDPKTLKAYTRCLMHAMEVQERFVEDKLLPHAGTHLLLSVAVGSDEPLDVNLKLSDLLGRLAVSAAWHLHVLQQADPEVDGLPAVRESLGRRVLALCEIFPANPVLLTPISDDQGIDLHLAFAVLVAVNDPHGAVPSILEALIESAERTHARRRHFPSIEHRYEDLLSHMHGERQPYEEATAASTLFPILAFWCGVLGLDPLVERIRRLREEHLPHATFQSWIVDGTSEAHLFRGDDLHGLADPSVDLSSAEACLCHFLRDERAAEDLGRLSACRAGLWPLVLVACRCHRLPPPLHLFAELKKHAPEVADPGAAGEDADL